MRLNHIPNMIVVCSRYHFILVKICTVLEKERRLFVMNKFFDMVVAEESGQGMVEYGLIIGIVALGLIAAFTALRGKIGNMFNNMTFTS